MTPFELSVCAELNRETAKDKEESDLFLAYINAYWQRVETLKPFNELMGKESTPKQMTAEEMLMNVMGYHSSVGGVTDPILEERG
ncbi:hypothetical protein [Paenibacillus sp. OV219]|uniref:hypothetical protein n=1 Tax=Paenibacillus sp. OV219 TaxID=1884377 RepID=UPI0008D5F596|nr:hypothetical protein [Paenibacillus sp. OV219]SEN19303.1 hypothetical protein SAMN05518847_102382 [Paenibacillus sp. OV219]